MTIHWPPAVCLHHREMFYLPLSSKFGSPGATWYCTSLHIHVVMNWKLSKRYPLTSIIWLYRGLWYRPIEVEDFFKVICWQVTSFQMIAGSSLFSFIHMEYVVFMSLQPRTIKILISNWPRTQKLSQLFRNTGGEDLFLPWSSVGHSLRPVFMLWLVKIWQVSFCGKFMQHVIDSLMFRQLSMFKTRNYLAMLATFPRSSVEIAVPFKSSILKNWKNQRGTVL